KLIVQVHIRQQLAEKRLSKSLSTQRAVTVTLISENRRRKDLTRLSTSSKSLKTSRRKTSARSAPTAHLNTTRNSMSTSSRPTASGRRSARHTNNLKMDGRNGQSKPFRTWRAP